jgi:hypothetical protein
MSFTFENILMYATKRLFFFSFSNKINYLNFNKSEMNTSGTGSEKQNNEKTFELSLMQMGIN